MKKFNALFLFLSLTVVSIKVKSQESSLWDAHVGFLVSQITGDAYHGFRKLGFNGGVGLSYPIDKRGHFVNFQLNYIQKGAKDRRNEEQGDYSDYTLAIDYLELPVSYLFPMWGIYMDLGISAAYKLRFKQINNGVEYPASNNLRAIELGLNAGLNFEINQHLSFSVKYLNSLTPIQKGTVSVYNWTALGGMHQIIALQLQYNFSNSIFYWDKLPIKQDE
jgi:hypothetical protein